MLHLIKQRSTISDERDMFDNSFTDLKKKHVITFKVSFSNKNEVFIVSSKNNQVNIKICNKK